jgi:dCMP deaminase
MGVKNCFEGGCPRCQSETPSFQDYDTCLCVHAEQNAIVLAARHGTSTENGILYTTLRPCFGCVKEAIQAGIKEIVYDKYFGYTPELEETYQGLVQEAGLKMRQFQTG